VILLDTSFVVAFHNRNDAHHEAASGAFPRVARGEWGSILLLEYVFLEIVTVLSARRDLATAVSVGEILLGAREIELVPCSSHFLSAYRIFREQAATHLSFTDAAIVAVARGRGADAIATFDRDFHAVPDLRIVPSS
jgi:predicted nucleic acid-binding protein